MTQEEYNHIEKLVECALTSPNKQEAQNYISKLQSFDYSLYGNAGNIFGQMLSYVKNSSGMVSDKERKAYFARMELHNLKMYVVEK